MERAREDSQAADELIRAYLPFIKAETARFLHRPPVEGHDDELSIAMIAFHEAIQGYSRLRGAFLRYAAVLIRNRLIDYRRREQRHWQVISLDAAEGEEAATLGERLADEKDQHQELSEREATRAEIAELSRQMQEFGVTLGDVADNCPRQERTLEACRRALRRAVETPGVLEEFLRTRRLPWHGWRRGQRSVRLWSGTAVSGGAAVDPHQWLRDDPRTYPPGPERGDAK